MSDTRYDLIVIGAGPGGYVAAIRAAQHGRQVALVECDELGGVCLNWGCIPTKALLHTASVLSQVRRAAKLGILVPEGTRVDLAQVVARSRRVAGQLRDGVASLLRKNRVEVHRGRARILGPGRVAVMPTEESDAGACSGKGAGKRPGGAAADPLLLKAGRIIIATGASPREVPGLPVDGRRIWNYRHALVPEAIPASLLVVGAGAIGMEFASFYAALGSQVTVVEAADRVLPAEDREVSDRVHAAFEGRGIAVHCPVTELAAEPSEDAVRVTFRTPSARLDAGFDRVLVCAGVAGNIANLGLETTRVRTTPAGCIVVDRQGATAEPGIHAIGDVCGAPMLAHKASHEAIACVDSFFGAVQQDRGAALDVASCTYCEPQVASIGLTEEQARQARVAIRVGRFPFRASGKALAMDEGDGFVKLVFDDETGELLGAHMVGAEVTELIHGMAITRGLEGTEEDLMRTIFPHPTLSEAIGEAAMAAFGRAIHA